MGVRNVVDAVAESLKGVSEGQRAGWSVRFRCPGVRM